ncbi:hypothetical protein JHL21_08085 [Devosia sp. WQ 349]|uniref:hypothetical protein n=1 Tax=Devosia sp. WQ 349K1 TaxID=2800329 RepID=UPI0019052CBF|nr:hypothetical protein [Devosia sp. WQ 349K1]MBK1794461.1 hypothetical protein [Devosia sp. WQ 349K1]
MPAISHCHRRNAAYYWRRWTPNPHRSLLQIALGVKDIGTARRLSFTLTTRSEDVFPLYTAGKMNKAELTAYLRRCLDEARDFPPLATKDNLAHALALRTIAIRGLDAFLTDNDRIALDRGWGQPDLGNRVESAIKDVRRQEPSPQQFVEDSITASLSVGRNPSGHDAEQAARARWLAEAARAFEAANDFSVANLNVDQYVAGIAEGKGLYAPMGKDKSLRSWLYQTISYLERLNPHEERSEFEIELGDLLDDTEGNGPTLLADLIRHSGPRHGGMEYDHEYRERMIEEVRRVRHGFPLVVEQMRNSFGPVDALGATHNGRSLHGLPLVEPTRPNAAGLSPQWSQDPEEAPKTIDEVAEIVLNRKNGKNNWDVKTAKQARYTFWLFSKLMKEEKNKTFVNQIRQPDVEHFNELLRSMYIHFGKSPKDKLRSIAEIRTLSASKSASSVGLDVVTRERHLNFLGILFNLAKETEQVDTRINPSVFVGVKLVRARDERPVPIRSSMSELFHAPVFTGCQSFEYLDEPGLNIFHRAAYWAPIIAYYQGMRREEYCGLEVKDVIVDHGEHPYFHLCFNKIRRLKNKQSVRNLCMHPELIRLGFLDYVATLRNIGGWRLFPDLYSPSSSSPLGDRLYDELKPLRKRMGLTLHQFRHFFNDELKAKQVFPEYRKDMMGHGGDSETTERYCKPVMIEQQLVELLKIEVRTSHLEPQPIRLLPWVKAKRPAPWARPGRSKNAMTATKSE